MSDRPGPAPERPSRYTRSFSGLLVAMVVTVLAVAAYVGVRALIRDQPDIEQKVDYLPCVAFLQQADVTVVHPGELPDGWHANTIHFQPGTPPAWRLGVVTADDRFVGVVHEGEDVEDLLREYVDEAPVQGEDASPHNVLGVTTWQTWSDGGGDHAFTAELDSGPLAGQTLLVYGSAPVAELEEFLASLTIDPVGGAASGDDCDTDDLE